MWFMSSNGSRQVHTFVPRYVDIPSYRCSNLGIHEISEGAVLVSYFAKDTIQVCLGAT